MKSVKHVFLIANPVMAMVAYEYISRAKNIDLKDVEVIYVRGLEYTLFDEVSTHLIKRTILNRAARRVTFLRTYPEAVRNLIEQLSDGFILYTSWLDAIASEVIKSSKCRAHCYIEEGQQSYKDVPVCAFKEDYKPPAETGSKKYKYDHYWRDDAKMWIGTVEGVFPAAPVERVSLLGELSYLKEKYKPYLKGGDVVMLLPTPGRLPKTEWARAIGQLYSHRGRRTFLKLHPAYYETRGALRKIEIILDSAEFSGVSLLPGNIILEAEMLFNRIKIVSDRSSVSRYAIRLGSEFVEVPFLYGEYYN
ncbi:hypothetical protein M9194_16220 [Vibrio sp. S4M6]|uniref:hypothetical protein n=1 Tax=Vibrio sinus TaxID=2946865 RepID=UPI00202A2471|nr:hypothetical protein [Vibrio sinus]MCL9782976.1 hypothetical protein [Vibrio sinus]